MSSDLIVFVIDDERPVVDSLCAMLTARGFRVEGFQSAVEFLRRFDPSVRGCVVADVKMPEMTGFQLQEELHNRSAQIPLVMITASAELSTGIRALKRGAINFLEKPFRPEDLVEAVREAFQVYGRATQSTPARAHFEGLLAQLTNEERAVLVGIVSGQTNAKIAEQLDISLRTMQFRRAEMMRKMGVDSKEELMNLVFSVGWSPN